LLEADDFGHIILAACAVIIAMDDSQSKPESKLMGRGHLACVALLACVAIRAAAQPSAEEILRRADETRFPREGVEAAVLVRTFEQGQPTEERSYKILSKGNENTLVLTLAPAADRGQILLMKGRDLWLYLPRVSQPVRLSFAQRLTGQVANGDIARANFSGDYTPKLVGSERLGNEALYVLDLTAVDRRVTYHRVRYWVRQHDFRPFKAEFYSLSNRLLKTCRYEDFKTMAGRVRPSRLVLVDALNPRSESIMDYSEMKLRQIPDQVFTKEYLRRLN
jgi:outer membrane lipoprotein-sorting protein